MRRRRQMNEQKFNKCGSIALVGAFLAVIGYLRYDAYPTLGIVFMALGLVLLVIFGAMVLFTKPYECPFCHNKEHRIVQSFRTKNGKYTCPACGNVSQPQFGKKEE